MKDKIKSVLISGGTHGNEMSGLQAVQNWQSDAGELMTLARTYELQFALTNQQAIARCTRFIDEDLNRQFSHTKLAQAKSNSGPYEVSLAAELNQRFGPKGESKTDFIIDIHNTTSNMGATLIVLENDEFHQQLARYVKSVMPEAVILVEDYQAFEHFAYFCTLGKRGLMIEVGPQPQGTLKAKAYADTLNLTKAVLSFIELYNKNDIAPLAAVEAYRLGKEVKYPEGPNGNKSAMIHPALDHQDFKLLSKGAVCFIDFAGNEIVWEGEDTYPHFIGEAAYNRLNIAFATAEKIQF